MSRHKNAYFMTYHNIKLEGTYCDIKPENLKKNLDFSEIFNEDKNYIKAAKILAEQYIENGCLSPEDIEAFYSICRISAADLDNLKGACIIAAFIEISKRENEIKQPKKHFNRWTKGKRLKATDNMIKNVLINHYSKKITQKKFCENNSISKYTYRSIVQCKVKNQDDATRIKNIASKLNQDGIISLQSK